MCHLCILCVDYGSPWESCGPTEEGKICPGMWSMVVESFSVIFVLTNFWTCCRWSIVERVGIRNVLSDIVIQGIIEISPQYHLLWEQFTPMCQEPQNHLDLAGTCCYEVWKCQEHQYHHPSRLQSPFLHSWEYKLAMGAAAHCCSYLEIRAGEDWYI